MKVRLLEGARTQVGSSACGVGLQVVAGKGRGGAEADSEGLDAPPLDRSPVPARAQVHGATLEVFAALSLRLAKAAGLVKEHSSFDEGSDLRCELRFHANCTGEVSVRNRSQ